MEQKQPLIAFGEGTLVSYGDFLANVQMHHELDKYVQGVYWNGERGCANGCTLNDAIHKPEIAAAVRELDTDIEPSNHALFEPLFGIQRIIAQLQDRIFEGLPETDAKEFPLQFAQAIVPGADYSNVWNEFALWLLVDSEYGIIRIARTERTKAAISGVAALYERAVNGDNPEIGEWREARVDAAAWVAWDADAVAWAWVEWAADGGRDAVAWDAGSGAWDTNAVAWAWVEWEAWDDRYNRYRAMRDKLLALLAETETVAV